MAQGTALSLSSGLVVAASAGTTIIGVSRDQRVFASNNQTVALAEVDFNVTKPTDYYSIAVTGGTSVVFDAALVTSNVINLKVNGVAMTAVTFATSNDATL